MTQASDDKGALLTEQRLKVPVERHNIGATTGMIHWGQCLHPHCLRDQANDINWQKLGGDGWVV